MNLIYYSVGNNPKYIDILNLSLSSLKIFYKKNFELLFIVDESFREFFENLIDTKIPYSILFTKTKSLDDSSSNKLKISNFNKIDKYNKIIYCDCDTLWFDTPEKIFSKIDDDLISVSNETHHNLLMTHKYWSHNLLKKDEIIEIENKKIQGFNAGFFAFSNKSVKIIENILKFYDENYKEINECIEQPYFNVYLFRNNLFNLNLNTLVNHNGYNITEINGEILVHFAGGAGHHENKINKIINFYKKNIE
jgi:hypothetical protein